MKPLLLVLLCLAIAAIAILACADLRSPSVAGSFYPGDPEQLRQAVNLYLSRAPEEVPPAVALVVPHAGYSFSAQTAAKGFAALRKAEVRRVILLGPSHRQSFSGGALPDSSTTAFVTPLGEVPLDLEALGQLRSLDEYRGPASAHSGEHCLEVELPFLQVVAPEAVIVPILVGAETDGELAKRMAHRLAPLLQPGTVVVVSSDLTHHGRPYGWVPFSGTGSELGETLLGLGRSTAGRVAAMDGRGFRQQVEVSADTICGARPIMVLLELLERAFIGSGSIVDLTTSGHVSRNWDQVVTYAAVSFTGSWQGWQEPPPLPRLGTLSPEQQQAVLELARATLRTHLGHGPELADWFAGHSELGGLLAPAGAFVTLHNTGVRARKQGRLRACMGIIEAVKPLADAVVHAAVNAAHDPRFPRMQREELDELHLEVSILSPTRPVKGPEEIEVGTHGVVLSKGGHSAVFLPQVAPEQGWDRDTMLSHLARKAGLPADGWRQGASFHVYTAQVFAEPEDGEKSE